MFEGLNILKIVNLPKSSGQYPENLEFPQLPGQYPETFCYIEHCTVLYCAEYQYPSEYKDFFKLGRMITITEYTVVTNNEIE